MPRARSRSEEIKPRKKIERRNSDSALYVLIPDTSFLQKHKGKQKPKEVQFPITSTEASPSTSTATNPAKTQVTEVQMMFNIRSNEYEHVMIKL
jgi:hypothetical protein